MKTIHPRVWYKKAPVSAQFEYLTYSFQNATADGEGFNLVVLEVDGWDMPLNGNTTRIETLMHEVAKKLDKKVLTSNDLAVAFYLNQKLDLDDEDERIERRKYTFEMRVFERGE